MPEWVIFDPYHNKMYKQRAMQFFCSCALFVHKYVNVKITVTDLIINLLMLLTYDVIMTVPTAHRLWPEELGLHYKSVASCQQHTPCYKVDRTLQCRFYSTIRASAISLKSNFSLPLTRKNARKPSCISSL